MQVDFGSFHMNMESGFFMALVMIIPLLLPLLLMRGGGNKQNKGVRGLPATEVSHVKKLKLLSRKAEKNRGKVIATLTVGGPILTSTVDMPAPIMTGVTYSDSFAELMDFVKNSEHIAAVIVRFITPGGTPAGADRIATAIEDCSKKKKVFAYVEGMSASGGVWGMVGAPEVISAPGSLIGSIGVIGPTLKRYEGITSSRGVFGSGVVAEKIVGKTVFAGTGKNMGDPFADEMQFDQAYKLLGEMVNDSYEEFVAHVAQKRDIEPATLKELGARVFSANKALEVGLIDAIMTANELKDYVAGKLVAVTDKCIFVTLTTPQPSKRGLFGLLSKLSYSMLPQLQSDQLKHHLGRELQLVIDPVYLNQL